MSDAHRLLDNANDPYCVQVRHMVRGFGIDAGPVVAETLSEPYMQETHTHVWSLLDAHLQLPGGHRVLLLLTIAFSLDPALRTSRPLFGTSDCDTNWGGPIYNAILLAQVRRAIRCPVPPHRATPRRWQPW